MSSLLGSLGARLLDRWIALLAFPGVLFVGAVWVASTLGQRNWADIGALPGRIRSFPGGEGTDTVATALLIVALTLAATAAGLAAQFLAGGLLPVWLGAWPVAAGWWERLAVRRRQHRWERWQDRFTREMLGELRDGGNAPAVAAARRRNRIALAEPSRPTWMGDQVAAVEARVRAEYGLDLVSCWPRLWLLLPDHAREEVRIARARVDACAVLASWGLLYLLLGAVWWPAFVAGALTGLLGWRSARQAISSLGQLMESSVDLYGVQLAHALHVDCPGRLTPEAGRIVTRLVRKGA